MKNNENKTNVKNKLMSILTNLDNRELEPDAFHLRELVPTIEADPHDINELTVWEYKIGDDILKIEWDMEDFTDCISIYVNGKSMYSTWNYENKLVPEYDDDAEDLFLLIMDNGGVLLQQDELDYVHSHLELLKDEILEKRKARKELWKI